MNPRYLHLDNCIAQNGKEISLAIPLSTTQWGQRTKRLEFATPYMTVMEEFMNFGKYLVKSIIHTAGYVIPGFDGTIIEQQGYEKAWSKVSTRRNPKTHKKETHVRFNPNGIWWSACKNLADFRRLLKRAIMACGLPETLKLSRTDFCLDFVCEDGDYTLVNKYNQLLIDCYIVGNDIQPKYEGSKHSRRTGIHLNTIASGGTLELAYYNKGIQKLEERVGNRLELRLKDKRHRDIEKALETIEKRVLSWKPFIPKALGMSNDLLVKKWMETRPNRKDGQSIPEFLRANSDRLFTRKQLVMLFEMLGQTAQQAETSTRNFLHRNPIELITEKDMMDYFDFVVEQITAYRKGTELSFVRVFGKEPWEFERVS